MALKTRGIGPPCYRTGPRLYQPRQPLFSGQISGNSAQRLYALIKNMLDHPRIKVILNTPFDSVKKDMAYKNLFYSGPIDEFFDNKYGELPYRSLKFEFVEYDREYFQNNSVINYPCNYDFTRIGEYKYFLNDQSPRTVVSYEYPADFVRLYFSQKILILL